MLVSRFTVFKIKTKTSVLPEGITKVDNIVQLLIYLGEQESWTQLENEPKFKSSLVKVQIISSEVPTLNNSHGNVWTFIPRVINTQAGVVQAGSCSIQDGSCSIFD